MLPYHKIFAFFAVLFLAYQGANAVQTTIYGIGFDFYYSVHVNNVTGNDAACNFTLSPAPNTVPCATLSRAAVLQSAFNGTNNTAVAIILDTDVVLTTGQYVYFNRTGISLFVGRNECIAATVDPALCQSRPQVSITCPAVGSSAFPCFSINAAGLGTGIYLLGINFYVRNFDSNSLSSYIFLAAYNIALNRFNMYGLPAIGSGSSSAAPIQLQIANVYNLAISNAIFTNMTNLGNIIFYIAGVSAGASRVNMSNVYYAYNYARCQNGQLLVDYFTFYLCTNCTFYRNSDSAINGGAAAMFQLVVRVPGARVSMIGCTFDGNSLVSNSTSTSFPYYGGALYLSNYNGGVGIWYFQDCSFVNNYVQVSTPLVIQGSAITTDGGNLTVVSSFFANNYQACIGTTCTGQGAAIWVSNTAVIILDSTFSCNYLNTTNANGGAIYMGGTSTLAEYNTVLVNNGIMYTSSGTNSSQPAPTGATSLLTDDGGFSCTSQTNCPTFSQRCGSVGSIIYLSASPTPSASTSPSSSLTSSITPSGSSSPSTSASPSSSLTPSSSSSTSSTTSSSATATSSPSPNSPSRSLTKSMSATATLSRSNTMKPSPSRSSSHEPSLSRSPSISRTSTRSPSISRSASRSPSNMAV